MTRLALFDCDGTLVDSQAAIVGAMTDAFADVGLPEPAAAAVRRTVGLSVPQAIAALAPAADARMTATLVATYKQAYQQRRRAGHAIEPLYDGIVAALDTLRAAGWRLGIATGKSDRGLALALAGHGIADRFVTLQTADRHPSKPHPAMAIAAIAEAGVAATDTVVIGDTGWDMAMAANAGARAIGVAWGYHCVDELRATGASAIAMQPRDLPVLIAQA